MDGTNRDPRNDRRFLGRKVRQMLHFMTRRLRAGNLSDENSTGMGKSNEFPQDGVQTGAGGSDDPSSLQFLHRHEAARFPSLISRQDLIATADCQALSPLFAKLPLEVRRQIYLEVWRAQIPSLRLHIHTSGGDGGPLNHTVCVVGHDEEPEEDTTIIQPWPHWPRPTSDLGSMGNAPPQWIWRAWCLRLRWGRHWKCQARIMTRWNPDTGEVTNDGGGDGDVLGVLLGCKRMYTEAIASLMSNITLILTSSEDAHRFFIQQPHPWVDHVRSLEFNFTHLDHLYLHNSVSCPARGPCRSLPFGLDMWEMLVSAIQPPKTNLRGVKVVFLGRPKTEYSSYLKSLETDAWKLDGKIEIEFTPLGMRFEREGGGEMHKA